MIKIDKSTWQKVKISNVFDKIEENDKVSAQNRFDRFLKVEHMDAESLRIKRWSSQEAGEAINPTFYKIFRAGQVLFPTRNPHLRRTALAHFDGICGEKTLTLEPKKELVDERYIPFLFHSEGFYSHSTAAIIGSTNPHCRWRDIANYEFLLPPKEQQAELAELLWAMEDVTEQDLAVLEKLKEYKSSIQRHYWDDMTGEYVEIGEVAKVFSGGTPDRKKPEYWNGSIPWIKTTEVCYNTIFETEEFITELGLKKSATKIIKPNSVLVAMYGQGITRGRVALTGIEACCNQACAVIETKDDFLPEFIYSYLEYKYEELRSLAHGANQQNLNLQMIKSFKIPKIEIDEQKLIRTKLLEISENRQLLSSKISASKALQKSLINEVF